MREKLFDCPDCGLVPERSVHPSYLPIIAYCEVCEKLQIGEWKSPKEMTDSERKTTENERK